MSELLEYDKKIKNAFAEYAFENITIKEISYKSSKDPLKPSFEIYLDHKNQNFKIGHLFNRTALYTEEFPENRVFEVMYLNEAIKKEKKLISNYHALILLACIQQVKLTGLDALAYSIVGLDKKIVNKYFEVMNYAFSAPKSKWRIAAIVISDPIFAVPIAGFLKLQYLLTRMTGSKENKRKKLAEASYEMYNNYSNFNIEFNPEKINKERRVYLEYIEVVGFTSLPKEKPLSAPLKSLLEKRVFLDI